MASDQGKFGRMAEVRRSWSLPGVRPRVAKQLVRQYIYAFAAVAPELGQMTALVLPDANTEMMNLFLAQVALELTDYFMIVQVDGATYHHSAGLVVPENIRLLEQRLVLQNSIPLSVSAKKLERSIFITKSSTHLMRLQTLSAKGCRG